MLAGKTVTETVTETATVVASAEPSNQPAAQAVEQVSAPVAEGFRVQLGAFSSPENANRGWEALRDAHPDLLADPGHAMSLYIDKSDLDDNLGAVFRVQVGPFETEVSAAALCDALRKRAVNCFLVKL